MWKSTAVPIVASMFSEATTVPVWALVVVSMRLTATVPLADPPGELLLRWRLIESRLDPLLEV
ncbi:MAG: hypothetical protein ACYTFH_08810 [Planctomycetota bacterium]